MKKKCLFLSVALLILDVHATTNANVQDDASNISNQALSLLKKGHYSESIALYEKLLKFQVDTFGLENPKTANSIINLGMAYSAIGNFAKAQEFMEKGQKINESTLGIDNPVVARGLRNLGRLYQDIGDYKKALLTKERGLEIRKKIFGLEHQDTADSFVGIGDLYSDIGDYDKALAYNQKAVAIYEKIYGSDNIETGRAITCTSVIYYNMGDFQKALPLIVRGLEISEKQRGIDDPYTAVCLEYLANIYLKTGSYSKALPLQERALAINAKTSGPESPSVARNLTAIAQIMMAMGNYPEAQLKQTKALLIDEKAFGPQHPETAICLRNLAELALISNNKVEARSIASRWVSAVNNQLQQMLNLGEVQRLTWASNNISFSIPAAILKPEKISDTILKWKSIVMDSLLEDHGLAKHLGGTMESRDALNRIQSIKSRIANLATSQEKNNAEEISRLQTEIEKIESSLGSIVNLGVRVRDSSVINIDQLCSSLFEGEAVLDFVIYHDILLHTEYYGVSLVTRNGEPLWLSVGKANEINEAINGYRKAIATGDETALKSNILILSNKLWKPISTVLPPDTKKIYFGADGPLNFLSVATLQDDKGKFLNEKYQIAYIGSGRDLIRPVKLVDKKRFVIYANPIFSSDNATNITSSGTNTNSFLGTRAVELAEFAKVHLPQLPGTELEASTVSIIAKDAHWLDETHMGADASKKGLMAIKAPAVLHLATHGFFLGGEVGSGDGERGMKIVKTPDISSEGGAYNHPRPLKGISPMRQSGVALTGGQSTLRAWGRGEFPDPANDGILTAEEVAGLDLDGTWLVTLSACETGVGQVQSGEGVFGLRRAFMMAGAQNLLMTLWPVSDEVTPKIMADFYKKALATGDAVGSLSDVQRDWLVKLRKEKGLLAAVRDAGPFAMVVMANPNVKQPLDGTNVIAQAPKSDQPITPAVASQDVLGECVQKTQAIMDQKIHQNDPSIQEMCTVKFKELLRRGLHATKDDPVPFLDADFRYDTQDDYPKVNSTGPAIQSGGKILVPVDLQFGTNAPFTKSWVFANENGSWLLDDVLTLKSGGATKSVADDLSKLPSPPESPNPSVQSFTVTTPVGSSAGSTAVLEFSDALAKADSGDAYAQAVVSIYYTLGYKTPKDASKGLTYALKSAAQKNPLGIYQVGVFRELGIGVKKDKNQAHKLMSSAFDDLNAMSGDPYALYDLAYLASKGIGVDQNTKEAARLYKASEDLGFSPSKNMPGASMTIEEYPSLIVGKWQPEHGPAWIYQSDGTYTREGTAEHGVYRFAGEKLILDNDPDGGVVDFISKDSFTFKGKREKKWPFVRISN